MIVYKTRQEKRLFVEQCSEAGLNQRYTPDICLYLSALLGLFQLQGTETH